MTTTKPNNKNAFTVFLKTALSSAGIGSIISLIIMFFITIFIVKINKHEMFHPILAVIIQSLPALISGSIMGKLYGHSLLILGIAEGVIIALFYLLISFCFFIDDINFNAFLTSVPYIISSSVLGSITSGSKKKKIK